MGFGEDDSRLRKIRLWDEMNKVQQKEISTRDKVVVGKGEHGWAERVKIEEHVTGPYTPLPCKGECSSLVVCPTCPPATAVHLTWEEPLEVI